MDFSLSTFVANLLASLVIAFVVYVLGQRNGKNQVDRADLRERYREILVHFRQLAKRTLDGDPMRRLDCGHKEDGNFVGGEPLVASLDRQGRLHDLQDANSLRAVEAEALDFGDRWHAELDHVFGKAEDLLEKMSRVDLVIQDGVVKTPDPTGSIVLKEPLGAVLVLERYELLAAGLSAFPEPGVALSYRDADLRWRRISASPEYLPLGTAAFVKTLREEALRLYRLRSVFEAREGVIDSLTRSIDTLERLSVDPHRFWATVKAALRDVFGR